MMDAKKQGEERDECREKKKGRGPIMIFKMLIFAMCACILFVCLCMHAIH